MIKQISITTSPGTFFLLEHQLSIQPQEPGRKEPKMTFETLTNLPALLAELWLRKRPLQKPFFSFSPFIFSQEHARCYLVIGIECLFSVVADLLACRVLVCAALRVLKAELISGAR